MKKLGIYDYVRVAKNLGSSMSHFKSDCDAIIVDQNGENYGLYIKDSGHSSWYYREQLTIINHNRKDLLTKWQNEADSEAKLKSDLDWIFDNGKDVLEKTHHATVEALAKCYGLTNLWGNFGEGLTYYTNAKITMVIARPFLEVGDKKGWLEHCLKMPTTTIMKGDIMAKPYEIPKDVFDEIMEVLKEYKLYEQMHAFDVATRDGYYKSDNNIVNILDKLQAIKEAHIE